jgi:RecA-family ATPase
MTPKRKFTLRTMSIHEILSMQEPNWLIDAMLPERALCALVGSSQAYKSFLALDWSLHIAYGLPWHGKEVAQGKVVYVAAEGDNGLKRRLEAWFKAHPDCDPKADVFKGILQSVNLVDEDALGTLQADIRKWAPDGVQLIVLDTLARSMHGDENSVEAMSLLVANVVLLQRLHASAVLFLHHTGHKNKDRARGSSALPGAVDVEYLLKRNGTQLSTTLINKKQKDEEPTHDMTLQLERLDLHPSSKGTPRSSLVITGLKQDKRWARSAEAKVEVIEEYLREHPDASLRQVVEGTGLPLTTVQRHYLKAKKAAKTLAKAAGNGDGNGGRRLRKRS